MNMVDKTFMVACKQHFGLTKTQKLSDFVKELKQLTDDDRADLKEDFKAIGINVTN